MDRILKSETLDLPLQTKNGRLEISVNDCSEVFIKDTLTGLVLRISNNRKGVTITTWSGGRSAVWEPRDGGFRVINKYT